MSAPAYGIKAHGTSSHVPLGLVSSLPGPRSPGLSRPKPKGPAPPDYRREIYYHRDSQGQRRTDAASQTGLWSMRTMEPTSDRRSTVISLLWT